MSFGFKPVAIKAAATKKKSAQITIHEDSRLLAAELFQQGWNHSITIQKLSIAIQKSKDNYDLFSAFVCRLKGSQGNSHDPFALYLEEFWSSMLKATPSFLRQWWDDVREDANKWRSWNGNLERYVFTPDHSLFQFDARSFTFVWCSRVDPWEKLLREYRNRKLTA